MSEGKVAALILSRDGSAQPRTLVRAGPLLIDEKEELLYTAPALIRGRMVLLSDERGMPVRLPWQSDKDTEVSLEEIDEIMADRFREVRLGETGMSTGAMAWLKIMGIVQLVLVAVVALLGVAFAVPKLLSMAGWG